MKREKILVVDDEEDILELMDYNLAKEGYIVTCVHSGEEALAEVKSEFYDLIILDLMLPGVDGLEVCKMLKNDSETAHIPIIMLTAKGEDTDIIVGLELGADDYITKPFSPKVLIARIRAALRREKKKTLKETGIITIRDLVINPARRQVFVKNKLIELTAGEFNILYLLAQRPGWVFTRNRIIDAIKGEGFAITDRSVDVQIAGLRKDLGEGGRYIETVRGIGYRFKG